ncbi:hypothetical protein VMCG_00446 [Cytospora schulzeri]|uniref:Serine/threonine-protein kinase ppk6 n=1 Tax=Cytospora schulzeri TaxID=448051 RepID=A0A423X9C2_9PEZI|nr:hypothetical protein VMCG_00446 [Valsa malicola]
MSADLFAEFGSFNSGTSQQSSNHTSQARSKPTIATNNDPFAFLSSPSAQTASPQAFNFQGPSPSQTWPTIQSQQGGSNGLGYFGAFGAPTSTPQQPVQESGDDDDAWGDFEEAPPSATIAQPLRPLSINNPPLPKTGLAAAPKPPPVRAGVTRVDTMDLMSNNLVGIMGSKKEPEPWQGRQQWQSTMVSSPSLWSTPPPPQPSPIPQITKAPARSSNPDVLFDADDFDGEAPDDDDDFGDFETGDAGEMKAASKEATSVQPAMADLLSIDFGNAAPQPASAPLPVPTGMSDRKGPPTQLLSTLNLSPSPHSPSSLYPHAPKSPAFSDRNPFPGLAVTTPVSGGFPQELKDDKTKSPDPPTAWPDAQSATDKDDWDSFAEFPAGATGTAPGGPSGASSSWDWDAVDAPQPSHKPSAPEPVQHKVSAPEKIGPPPTNIPPPSILLSIFTELLEEAELKLYKPTAKQPQAVKDRIYSDPATLSYLKGYIVLATVAARILTGRRLRWHRDKFLAQGMSISAAGSKGGMKLAGVDKAQTAREDREAADVVGVWRDYVGKLKTAVAQANIGMQKQPVKMEPLKVPEINDHMAVTTAKVVPTAPKACVVCGLKRDERVKGVDIDVEDSFGEWWIDHWGHRTCRNFWLRNEGRLRSR